MTTCAWDGKSLATDTRIGTTKERTDDSAKIHQFKTPIKVNGHEMLVAATSGRAYFSRKALEILSKNPENGELLSSILRDAWGLVLGYETISFSLLLIGSERNYIFTCERLFRKGRVITKVRWRRHKRTEKLAIGSGGKIAKFLMEHFDVPAQLAIAGAATVDSATGSHVQYTRVTTSVGKINEHFYKRPDTTMRRIRAYIHKPEPLE